MKGKHAQKNFSAVGAMAPTPLSLKTRGAGGCRIQGPGPAATPVVEEGSATSRPLSATLRPPSVPTNRLVSPQLPPELSQWTPKVLRPRHTSRSPP